MKKNRYDVIIIGAGAAGLMAAFQAGQRGRKTLLIEHTGRIGEKIRISGGGRCNFTNLNASAKNYICQNPHFIKSALASYTVHDFIKMVELHRIRYHEKTLGQLFCDGSSQQIIDMLVDLCQKNQVKIALNCHITDVSRSDYFQIQSNLCHFECESLIVACGGLSIPKIGASDFGYRLAKQFTLSVISPRPALVPLIVDGSQKSLCNSLRGISNYSLVTYKKTQFLENILFTHKGISGPSILQISSYLPKFQNEEITLNLLPNHNLMDQFLIDKNIRQTLINYLKTYLPNRLVEGLLIFPDAHKKITDLKKDTLLYVADLIHNFKLSLEDSEGYQKAEVTVGGINTDELSSKTMECKKVPNLFFIGEVVDVTGWLGGYNFQWAWSSGVAAGKYC